MLAGGDDYTPAPLAVDYAQRMRLAGNRRIKVKVYGGAHHGWESIGPVFDIRDAENWSCCTNRSEEHTSELQSHLNLVCRLLLEKKKKHYANSCAVYECHILIADVSTRLRQRPAPSGRRTHEKEYTRT